MDSAVAKRNFLIYAGVSTLFLAMSIANVIEEKSNYYSALIALSHGLHVIVLSNFLVVTLIILGKSLQLALFGELRLIERDHVYERSWFTMMNLLMEIAMFRDENNLLVGFLVLSLLFAKIFHWILIDRVQHVFQTHETIREIVFTRASFTLCAFLILDFKMIMSCIDSSFKESPDVYMIFGFDFALLFFGILEEFGKAVLNLAEIWYLEMHEGEDVWELKSVLVKIFEITLSFVKIATICFNFFILIGPYRMPLTVIREMYLTVMKAISQVNDFIRYRKASKELDEKLQNATQEDLEHDDTCIICRDEMEVDGVSRNTRLFPKKLNCGHVIHLGCLKSWMERSDSCPMCRAPVFGAQNARNSNNNTNTDNNNNNNNNNAAGVLGVGAGAGAGAAGAGIPGVAAHTDFFGRADTRGAEGAALAAARAANAEDIALGEVGRNERDFNVALQRDPPVEPAPARRQRRSVEIMSNFFGRRHPFTQSVEALLASVPPTLQPPQREPEAEQGDGEQPAAQAQASQPQAQPQAQPQPQPQQQQQQRSRQIVGSAVDNNPQFASDETLLFELPSNSLVLPPDWVLFPLKPVAQEDPSADTSNYEILLNSTQRANLKIIKMGPSLAQPQLYHPPQPI